MKNIKKILFFASILVIVLGFGIYQTIAYLNVEAISQNVISTGKIKTQLIQKRIDSEGNEIDVEQLQQVVPGKSVSQIVSVKNTGNQPEYVRVVVTKLINDNPDKENLLISLLELNKTDWTFKDGYYYYNYPLEVNQQTSVLFTGVYFSEEIDNEYADAIIQFSIEAEATQVANNGSSALDAKGWPKK